MTLSYIIILSFVQGLTEFLPISSSGHLVLVPHFLGQADQGILMDVALHMGTMTAIIIYYWRDVWAIARDVLCWKPTPQRELGIYIALGTIPAVLFGAFIHFVFPDGIRSIEVIAATTIIFGILMGVADYIGPRTLTISNMTLKKALLIGLAQAVALIPGTSRSGITMTAARFLGFDRVDAAKFSFLLGIPAMAAAGCLSFLDVFESGDAGLLTDAAWAIFFAFLAGLAAIHFMMKFLPRFGLLPFVVYRLFLGAFLLAWFVF